MEDWGIKLLILEHHISNEKVQGKFQLRKLIFF